MSARFDAAPSRTRSRFDLMYGWKVEEGEQRFAILRQGGSSPSMKAARAVPTYLYPRIDNIAVAHARFARAKHELGGRTDESIFGTRRALARILYEFHLQ